MSMRKRTTHSKSRKGCLGCKRRHRKCDEIWPICTTCEQLGEQCTWPHNGPNSIQIREFRTFTPRNIAPIVEPDEARDIEHFCSRTLGFLQEARPSVLWKHSLSFLLYSSPAFRKIVTAFGNQQRLLTLADPSDPFFVTEQQRADWYYSRALRSLRQSIATRVAGDRTPLVLGAVLMMLLESLRNSPDELLIHLGCAVHIVSETRTQSKETDEYEEALALLQALYTSCMVYCSAPGRRAQRPGFLSEHKFKLKPPAALDSLAAVSQEMSILNVDAVCASDSMFEADDVTTKRAKLIAAFSRIQQRHERLREAMEGWDSSGSEDHPSLYVIRAGILIREITINAILSSEPSDKEQQRNRFVHALDLLEQAFVRLNAIGHGSHSFSIVIGPLSMLDVITSTCGDDSIRQRILQMLELCPQREVLWQAEEMRTTLAQKLQASQASGGSSHSMKPSTLSANIAGIKSAGQSLGAGAVRLYQHFEDWGQTSNALGTARPPK